MSLFESEQRVLAIGSHPDDIEYACSGTLLKLREKYRSFIKTVVMSYGSKGDPSSGKERLNETNDALIGSGVSDEITAFDRHFPDNPNLNIETDTLREIILDFKPDIILTHSPLDTHQEHVLTNKITVTAARRVSTSVLEYPMLSTTPSYIPSVFSDITAYIKRKLELLKMHETQLNKSYMSTDFLKLYNKSSYALLHSCEYVETFSVHRFIFK